MERGGGGSRAQTTRRTTFKSVGDKPYGLDNRKKDRLAAATIDAVLKLVRDYLGDVAGSTDRDSS